MMTSRLRFHPWDLGKIFLTVCLSLFFAQMIAHDYQKISGATIRFAAPQFVLDRSRLTDKARVLTINRLLPKSFDYLLAFAEKKEKFNLQKFTEYQGYYKKVVEYMPLRADAQAMLGFCYYHLNKPSEAIAAFQKAIDLYPQYSGSYYNLGVIYFKSGNYPAAINVLKKAVVLQPQAAVEYIMSSREIYLPFLFNQKNPQEFLALQLRTSYRYSHILLSQSHLRFKGTGQSSYPEEEKIDLRIF